MVNGTECYSESWKDRRATLYPSKPYHRSSRRATNLIWLLSPALTCNRSRYSTSSTTFYSHPTLVQIIFSTIFHKVVRGLVVITSYIIFICWLIWFSRILNISYRAIAWKGDTCLARKSFATVKRFWARWVWTTYSTLYCSSDRPQLLLEFPNQHGS